MSRDFTKTIPGLKVVGDGQDLQTAGGEWISSLGEASLSVGLGPRSGTFKFVVFEAASHPALYRQIQVEARSRTRLPEGLVPFLP